MCIRDREEEGEEGEEGEEILSKEGEGLTGLEQIRLLHVGTSTEVLVGSIYMHRKEAFS